MITSYYTLQALVRELHRLLSSAKIEEAFTQQKNELLINLNKGAQAWTLTVSTDPHMNFVFLRDRFPRAKKNSVDIFPSIVGDEIREVTIHRNDRIIQVDLREPRSLLLHLFGGAANVLLVDKEGIVAGAFKHAKQLTGNRYDAIQPDTRAPLPESEAEFDELMRAVDSGTAIAAVKSAIPTLGSTLTREIFHRAHVDEKQQVTDLNGGQRETLWRHYRTLSEELISPSPVIYFREDHPRAFSLVPLHHMAGASSASYPTVNEAVRVFIAATFRVGRIEQEKNGLLKVLKREMEKSHRSLQAITKELQEHDRAEEYERVATVIMGNLQHLTKGTKAVDLPDLYSDMKNIRITMDPKLTPVQNAGRYFAKAKKARHGRLESAERRQSLQSRIATVETLQLHLDYCNSEVQLKEFYDQHKKELLALNLVKEDRGKPRLPFRVFTVEGGFEVWVGKNSEQNDLLTMKYAKPNDLWFHARGAGGSHVVLKVGTGRGEPGKAAKEQAASIAAYYSRMKRARHVPVAYCERKYVRKPKGAHPGSVMLEREKVIFVDPELPSTAEG